MKSHLKKASLAVLGLVACAQSSWALNDPNMKFSLNKELFAAGEEAQFKLVAEPGDYLVLLLGSSRGPVKIPGFGELGVGLFPNPPALIKLGFMPDVECLEFSCTFDCGSAIFEGVCYMQVVAFDKHTFKPAGKSNPISLEFVADDCGLCVDEAIPDECAKYSGGHALTLPGIDTEFVFVSGGEFIENVDGTAKLTGVVARQSNPCERFFVDVDFGARMSGAAGADYPPPGSPKRELLESAYYPQGPVNVNDWRYYETTFGKLVGMDCYAGAEILIDRAGPAFQVGRGANGKNKNYGASGWLHYEVLSQPWDDDYEFDKKSGKGDFNLDFPEECVECPEPATNHAVWLPKIGKKYVWMGDPTFVENDLGRAKLEGTIVHVDHSDRMWEVEVDFSERVNPGNADYPPTDSPKLELADSKYVDGGGMIDPDTWYYYLVTEGELRGLGVFEGAELAITRKGPAFQVGLGASGKDMDWGASGWFMVEIMEQPENGMPIPENLTAGDINIDLSVCPDDQD